MIYWLRFADIDETSPLGDAMGHQRKETEMAVWIELNGNWKGGTWRIFGRMRGLAVRISQRCAHIEMKNIY
jgi:hypothetical protein